MPNILSTNYTPTVNQGLNVVLSLDKLLKGLMENQHRMELIVSGEIKPFL